MIHYSSKWQVFRNSMLNPQSVYQMHSQIIDVLAHRRLRWVMSSGCILRPELAIPNGGIIDREDALHNANDCD